MPSPANLPLNFNRDRTERQLNARLEELLEKLRSNRPSDDPWLVRRAYDIAAERHRDQFRSSGDPYITHLLEVAHILADMRLDATTLAAALLHDVIEDTRISTFASTRTIWRRSRPTGGRRHKNRPPEHDGARKRARPKTCARCCWRWCMTSASC